MHSLWLIPGCAGHFSPCEEGRFAFISCLLNPCLCTVTSVHSDHESYSLITDLNHDLQYRWAWLCPLMHTHRSATQLHLSRKMQHDRMNWIRNFLACGFPLHTSEERLIHLSSASLSPNSRWFSLYVLIQLGCCLHALISESLML